MVFINKNSNFFRQKDLGDDNAEDIYPAGSNQNRIKSDEVKKNKKNSAPMMTFS